MNEEESHRLLVGSADDDEHEFEINLHENGWSLANGRNSDHCHNNLLRSRTEVYV